MFGLGLFVGYLIFGNSNNTVQAPNQTASLTPTVTQIVSPTSTSSASQQTGKKGIENKYFRLQFPSTWQFTDTSSSKGKNEIAHYSLQQSSSENDGGEILNYYSISVMSNEKGQDAMTFSKNDITTNWQPAERPTYEAYPLNNLDAVVVKDIIAGKGAWGPSVYILNNKIAVQIISGDPLEDPDKYFYPVVNSFSFVTPH